MIVKCNEVGNKHNGLVSVGIVNVEPAVVNVIPNKVSFVYDARHESDETLAKIHLELEQEFKKIADSAKGDFSSKPLKVEIEHLFNSKAVNFHEKCISHIKNASVDLYGENNVREIMSGAGHDSCSTSSRCPTSMIFIPSRDGISHSPEEYSSPELIDNGLNVLLNAVLSYDQSRQN